MWPNSNRSTELHGPPETPVKSKSSKKNPRKHAERMDNEQLALQWMEYSRIFNQAIKGLRGKAAFTDATLACEGTFYPVHKFVLSTCSEYFSAIFEWTPCVNPVVVLNNIACKELEALLDFMYIGEASIQESQIQCVMRAAECLRIRGLAMVEDTKAPVSGRSRSSSNEPAKKRRRPDAKKQDVKKTVRAPSKDPMMVTSKDQIRVPPKDQMLVSQKDQMRAASKTQMLTLSKDQMRTTPKDQIRTPARDQMSAPSLGPSQSVLPSPSTATVSASSRVCYQPIKVVATTSTHHLHTEQSLGTVLATSHIPALSDNHSVHPSTQTVPQVQPQTAAASQQQQPDQQHQQQQQKQYTTPVVRPTMTTLPHTQLASDPHITYVHATQNHRSAVSVEESSVSLLQSSTQLSPLPRISESLDLSVAGHSQVQEGNSIQQDLTPFDKIIQSVKIEIDPYKQQEELVGSQPDGTVIIPDLLDSLVEMRPLYDTKPCQDDAGTSHSSEAGESLYDFPDEFGETSGSQCDTSYFKSAVTFGLPKSSREKLEDGYRCLECDRVFPKKDSLTRHMHKHNTKKVYNCNHCSATYMSYKDMALHRKENHSLHKCTMCPFTSKRMDNMKRHMMRHSGDKPICCPHCDYRGRRPQGLRSHMQKMHADIAPPAK